MTALDRAVRWATAELARAGVPSPGVDAELLAAHVLDRDPGEVRRARVLGERLGEETVASYRQLVDRRASRVPLQHLTGTAHFHGLQLRVGPGVFVPRPETEVLVGLALSALPASAGAGERPVLVDLCTGSGAIALAVAAARPGARVAAVELSQDAIGYAAANVEALGLPVDLRQGRAQDAFPELLGEVDVVTCNPPYIPPDAVPVDLEVRGHDPHLALYGGGADGLEVPLQLAAHAWRLLRPGGVLLMEHADSQGHSLPTLLRARGWSEVEDHRDLAGRPRVTRAVRPVSPVPGEDLGRVPRT